jgi:hypothetical protein
MLAQPFFSHDCFMNHTEQSTATCSAKYRSPKSLMVLPTLIVGWLSVLSAQAVQEQDFGQQRPATTTRAEHRFVISGEQQFKNQLLNRELNLLRSHSPTRTEIDVLDYQEQQLNEIVENYNRQIAELGREPGLKVNERASKIQELYDNTDHELNAALLPDQRKRLQQVALQSFGIAQGQEVFPIANLLGNSQVRSYLGIDTETAKKMRLKMQEENQKLLQEFAALREQANQAVLDVLSASERKKLEDLLGAPFDFGKMEQSVGGKIQEAGDK